MNDSFENTKASNEGRFFECRRRVRETIHGGRLPPATLSEILADYAVLPERWQEYLDRSGLDDPTAAGRVEAMLRERPEMQAMVSIRTWQGAAPESGAQAGLFTQLARTGQTGTLIEQFRPFAPYLLEVVGLDTNLAEEFLEFVEGRLPDFQPQQRFRDVLPEWLEEFAAIRQRVDPAPIPWHRGKLPANDQDWLQLVERMAVARFLDGSPRDEPSWARQLRRELRRQTPASADEILDWSGPVPRGVDAEWLADVRCRWYRQIQGERQSISNWLDLVPAGRN